MKNVKNNLALILVYFFQYLKYFNIKFQYWFCFISTETRAARLQSTNLFLKNGVISTCGFGFFFNFPFNGCLRLFFLVQLIFEIAFNYDNLVTYNYEKIFCHQHFCFILPPSFEQRALCFVTLILHSNSPPSLPPSHCRMRYCKSPVLLIFFSKFLWLFPVECSVVVN